jgi:acyl dehydratase
MTMRLLVDGLLADAATLGAKGVDDLRWWKPVFPDDTLSARVDVVETDPERPERGLVRLGVTTTNDRGDDVFSMVGNVLFARREGE